MDNSQRDDTVINSGGNIAPTWMMLPSTVEKKNIKKERSVICRQKKGEGHNNKS